MRILSKTALLLISLLSLSTLVMSEFAGTAAGVGIGVVDQVKKIGMPIIQQKLNDVQVGTIEFSGGSVQDLDLKFKFNNFDNIKVGFSGANNGVSVDAHDISGEITGKFAYKFLFIHTSGNFKVAMDNDAVKLTMAVPLTSQNINGRSVPAVDIKNFNLNIDSSKIHITLSGSILADIADAFVFIFKRLIIYEITKVVNKDVPDVAKSSINKILASTNGRETVYGNIMLDFTFPAQPKITDSNMDLFLNATLYDSSRGSYYIPAVAVADVQMLPATSNSVELSVSHYTADSLFAALQEMNLFKYHLDPAIAGKFASMLTTTFLDGLLPGIEAKYGKDLPVSVGFKSTSSPNALFQKNDFGVLLDLDLTFEVNNETAIVISFEDFSSTINVSLDKTNLKIQVEKCAIDQVQASQSKIGDFNVSEFKAFFNVASRAAIPFINNMLLENPFVLPDTFLGVVKIIDAQFQSFDNYLAVSVTPQIIA
ncbi:bactericidal permeability-increasing [Stylonychia lemnae]|uniref:Bactericidal permeability-increasing n=1 Tax=Stylonychia lemnae TaxID=5949 RepID=A0A078A3P4_STYLE|nr:bactericidal permeability-increasing [Stylonychia lemnae]|eukprot:CDW76442.1 bactericidal permeability-increasing [Stylonychia lemnae]